MTQVKYESDFEQTKETPYLICMGEIWNICVYSLKLTGWGYGLF